MKTLIVASMFTFSNGQYIQITKNNGTPVAERAIITKDAQVKLIKMRGTNCVPTALNGKYISSYNGVDLITICKPNDFTGACVPYFDAFIFTCYVTEKK